MKTVIVDVREPVEYEAGHVEGAINVPLGELTDGESVLKDIPKSTPLILYCRTGARSMTAIRVLKQQGFTMLTNGINQESIEKIQNTA